MKTRDVALALRLWASEHKLLYTALPEPEDDELERLPSLGAVQQSLDRHVELFERNLIVSGHA